MLIVVREPAERPAAFEGLAELHVRGLPADDARELLASFAAGSFGSQYGRADRRGDGRKPARAGGACH